VTFTGAPLRSVTLPEKRHLATDGVLEAGAAAAGGGEGEGEEIGAAVEGEHLKGTHARDFIVLFSHFFGIIQ
jgi:hypothetical protein